MEGRKKSSFHRIGRDTLFNTRPDTIYIRIANTRALQVIIILYVRYIQCAFDSILMRVESSRKLFQPLFIKTYHAHTVVTISL